MLEELVNIANKLDCMGLVKEADYLDAMIKKADEVDYSPETRQSLESAMNMDDMQSVDNRIKELESLVKEKFDRGDFIENRLYELKTQEDPTAESIKEIAEYSKEFSALDLEATELLAELVQLSFSQGRILSTLRSVSGLVGVNAEEESLIKEVEDMVRNLEEGVPQYNWGVSNVGGDIEERNILASRVTSMIIKKSGLRGGLLGRVKNKWQRMTGQEVVSGRITPFPEGEGNWINISVPYSDADVENISSDALLFVAIIDKLSEEMGLKEPVITSGYRDALKQAEAMHKLWTDNPDDPNHLKDLYGEKCKSCSPNAEQIAVEVLNIFKSTEDHDEAIQTAGEYIGGGNLLSAHNANPGTAIDYRLRGHDDIEKILRTAESRGYLESSDIIDETENSPPHWHVTVGGISQTGVDYLLTPNSEVEADRGWPIAEDVDVNVNLEEEWEETMASESLKELVKLSNELDSRGLVKEADYLDDLMKKAETSLQGLPADNLSPELRAKQELENWKRQGAVDWCVIDALGAVWATTTTDAGVTYIDQPIQTQRKLLNSHGLSRAMHPEVGVTPERDCKPKENAG